MNGKLIFVFLLLGFLSCSERDYDGAERYIVQGTIVVDGQPLEHELILIDTYVADDEKNDHYQTSAIWYFGDYNTVVNTTYTDKNGFFKLSFPGGKYTYVLYTENYRYVLFNGKYTKPNNIIDLGTVHIDSKKQDDKKE